MDTCTDIATASESAQYCCERCRLWCVWMNVVRMCIQLIIMFAQDQFANITHLFYSGEYTSGLREISKVIAIQTNNSNLYVNRALFLSQLGNDQQAIEDIEHALKINPRNYIAYFNLFSILTKLVQDEEALKNLCCSLSCLYLIRGKLTKNLHDVDAAINYAKNNHEAHVLKGLLLMKAQKYEQSLRSFQNALDIDPNSAVIRNIITITAEKGHLHYQIHTKDTKIDNSVDYRLKSSHQHIDEVDVLDEIDKKLIQYNKLYIDINENAGAITQKVPKEDSVLSFEDVRGRRNKSQQIKVIYDSGLSTPQRQSQVHPEPGNAYIKLSIIQHEKTSMQQEKKEFHQRQQSPGFEEENFISIINHQQKKQEQKEQNLIDQEFSSVLNMDRPFQEIKQAFESVICEPLQLDLPLEQKVEEKVQLQGMQPIEHYNLIYPIDDHMKLKISVLHLQFIDKDQQFLSKLTDIYCILSYNNGNSKLKSNCKQCQGNVCTWNQEFEPIAISETPKDMKIKIYNKKYKSVRDEFLGDLEVLITTADLLKLPLYSKQNILGNLLMNLQLVEVTPPPQPQEEH